MFYTEKCHTYSSSCSWFGLCHTICAYSLFIWNSHSSRSIIFLYMLHISWFFYAIQYQINFFTLFRNVLNIFHTCGKLVISWVFFNPVSVSRIMSSSCYFFACCDFKIEFYFHPFHPILSNLIYTIYFSSLAEPSFPKGIIKFSCMRATKKSQFLWKISQVSDNHQCKIKKIVFTQLFGPNG